MFYNNRAYAEIKLGLYENAMLSYKNAIDISPDNGVYYKNLGNLHYTKGNYQAAEEVFAKAAGADAQNG